MGSDVKLTDICLYLFGICLGSDEKLTVGLWMVFDLINNIGEIIPKMETVDKTV